MTSKRNDRGSVLENLQNRLDHQLKQWWLNYILASFLLIISGAVYAQMSQRIIPIITFLLDEIENKLKAIPTYVLNDTGIAKGLNSDGLTFNSTCVANTAGPQDCNYGADLQLEGDDDGYAGFSFTFVDDKGELQEPQDKNSACAVLDNVTGLMWDSGRPKDGLKSPEATFTWYDSQFAFQGLQTIGRMNTCPGFDDGVSATYCNTEAYIARLNAARWCGHDDWRIANINELNGIQMFYDGSGSEVWLSKDHFFPTSASWSSTLFLFDGFFDNAGLFFLYVSSLSTDNTGAGPDFARASNELNSILAVRND